eukprot:1954717-Prymnesium_polylepis.1
MLGLVTRAHLLDAWADEGILPIVVELDHAPTQEVAGADRLLGKLARAREDRLHVGRGRALAADPRQVHCVVERKRQLVVCPERTRVEPSTALVVLVLEALPQATRGAST